MHRFCIPSSHVVRAKTVNMAHNRSNKESVDINSIINNAIQSISRLRDMQPAVNGNQSNSQLGQQSQPTIASEVVRLFPTFQQPQRQVAQIVIRKYAPAEPVEVQYINDASITPDSQEQNRQRTTTKRKK